MLEGEARDRNTDTKRTTSSGCLQARMSKKLSAMFASTASLLAKILIHRANCAAWLAGDDSRTREILVDGKEIDHDVKY